MHLVIFQKKKDKVFPVTTVAALNKHHTLFCGEIITDSMIYTHAKKEEGHLEQCNRFV